MVGILLVSFFSSYLVGVCRWMRVTCAFPPFFAVPLSVTFLDFLYHSSLLSLFFLELAPLDQLSLSECTLKRPPPQVDPEFHSSPVPPLETFDSDALHLWPRSRSFELLRGVSHPFTKAHTPPSTPPVKREQSFRYRPNVP